MKNVLFSIIPVILIAFLFSLPESGKELENKSNYAESISEGIPLIVDFSVVCTEDRATDPVCAAGGPGSESCSYTAGPFSCEVSCRENYYSCCSLSNGCTCIPESTPGEGG